VGRPEDERSGPPEEVVLPATRLPAEILARAREQSDELRHPALVPGSPMADPRLAAALVPLRAPDAPGSPRTAAVRPATSYRLARRPRRRLGVLAIGLASLGLAVAGISASLAVGSHPGLFEELSLLVPALLLFTAALVLARTTRSLRLVVTDDGVTCHGFFSVISADWADVSRVDHVGHGIFEGPGLVLARDGIVRAPRLLRRLGIAGSPGFVPLAPFAAPLATSELEADLRQRCPRLLARGHQRVPGVHL